MPADDASAPPIYFIRHGETDWNREARLQGGRDVPLNPLGRVQAEEAGRRLATLVGDPGALPFRASPLGRTRATAELARSAIGLPPDGYELDERLAEITFGEWEGLTWREVRAKDLARARLRERDKWNFVPPGGESYAMLRDRVRPAIADLSGPTVLVSHGGVARAVLTLRGCVPDETATRLDIWQGRVLVIEDGAYRWV